MNCKGKLGRSGFLATVITAYLFACSDPDPGPKDENNLFVIDGVTHTPVVTEVVNTGTGFLIRLEDEDYEISFLLPDSVSGDYGIVPANQTVYHIEKATIAYWTDNSGNVFYSDAGTISITVENNKVTGAFYAMGKDLNDKPSFINSGAITNIEASYPSTESCLLSSMRVSYPGGSLPDITTNTYGYDKDGRLVKRVELVPQQSVPSLHYYFWQDDRIIRVLSHRYYKAASIASWNYDGEKLISIVTDHYEDGSFKYRSEVDFEYTGDKVSKLTRSSAVQDPQSYFVQYNGSNISTVSYVNELSEVITITYSQYDTHNVPYSLLAASMSTSFNPEPPEWSSASFPMVFSAHNFGNLEEVSSQGGSSPSATVVYPAFNNEGYPLEFTLHWSTDVTAIHSFTYIGCGS